MDRRRINILRFTTPVSKVGVQSLSSITKKPSTDEKKNLSKHHLFLPDNTQVCVETLLSTVVR